MVQLQFGLGAERKHRVVAQSDPDAGSWARAQDVALVNVAAQAERHGRRGNGALQAGRSREPRHRANSNLGDGRALHPRAPQGEKEKQRNPTYACHDRPLQAGGTGYR